MNEKETLLDLLVHDLTGPLSIVSAGVSSLLTKEDRYGPLTQRQRQSLVRTLRNSNRAQGLIKDLIEVYRSEDGLFSQECVQVPDLVRESLLDALEITRPEIVEKLSDTKTEEMFAHILEEHGVFVQVTGRYQGSPFVHDRKKVQQVLRNLISNALKYCRNRVNISVSGDTDLVVSVEDDGSGIPEPAQKDIFKRFAKLRKEESADARGLGFGLSCVKTIVEAMGGEITLMSTEGRGARFTVRIPSFDQNA